MTKTIRALLFWTLILCACSPVFPSTEAIPQYATITSLPPTVPSIVTSQATPDSPTPPPSATVITQVTADITQLPESATTVAPSYPQDCGYQWAYQDLPELSSSFLQSIEALQPGAQATAFSFGEDCVHADLSRTFLPMETDFNVTLPVNDLSDEAALGEWVVKVMQVIEAIPPEQIIGPRPGRVGIFFEANGEKKGVSFYVDQYRALASGLSYQEIYQALQAPQ